MALPDRNVQQSLFVWMQWLPTITVQSLTSITRSQRFEKTADAVHHVFPVQDVVRINPIIRLSLT